MTEAEKMLALMASLGAKQKEDQQEQMNEVGKFTRMMYDGYVNAGFSPKMAFEFTKACLTEIVSSTLKK